MGVMSRCICGVDCLPTMATIARMIGPKQCFVSYSHHDHAHFQKLIVGIRALANIYGFTVWSDQRIQPGQYWSAEIAKQIERSEIFICVTTNSFFGSDYIFRNELPAIKLRHKEANALVLPIVFEECCWFSFFGNYIQLAPSTLERGLLPVMQWKNKSEALGLAINSFAKAIEEWFGIQPSEHFASRPQSDLHKRAD